MDQVSEFGFTANDTLMLAGGTHQATLNYISSLGAAPLKFPNDSSALKLEIEGVGTASSITQAHIPDLSDTCTNALWARRSRALTVCRRLEAVHPRRHCSALSLEAL